MIMSKEVIFKQSCLIRKNTPELRDKLSYLGYKIAKLSETEGRKYGILCNGKVAVGIPENCQEFNLDEYLKNNPQIIDCGKNEELFLAIAALRDDEDVNQWHVIDIEAYTNLHKGDWFKATDRTGGYHVGCQIEPAYCHKATVEELIEHFK